MNLPSKIESVLSSLRRAGFEAYVVGGCVRDLLLRRPPKDWDIATNAKPAEIQAIFPKSFYKNNFGTVTVGEVEITTYRVDLGYSDQRHPDDVKFVSNLKEDLARRDFTINAMALSPPAGGGVPRGREAALRGEGEGADTVIIDDLTIIDPFGGLKDLNQKLIRAVGDPDQRFSEDALRLLRAIRFSAQLNFTIEPDTLKSLSQHAATIQAVSQERIRDELIKIIMSEQPEAAFNLLEQTGLLKIILPELAEGIGIDQNKHHIYTVFQHNIKSLQFAARYDYPLDIRLAALLHDVGKPKTRRFDQKSNDHTFYAHEIVGAKMAKKLLERLRFPVHQIKKITHLIRHHMFYYDIGQITDAGIRRLLRRVGPENFDDLIKLRIAERKGSGVPKARPYRLRHLQFMAEKVSQQAITVGQLKIDGHDLMNKANIKPGPQIGGILNALLAEVIDDPSKNNPDYLLKKAEELKTKNPADLKQLGAAAIEKEEQKRDDDIKRKYHV